MGRLDLLHEFHHKYDSLGYYDGGGDNDHDGTPDRADVDDGNGLDCSGDVWAAFKYAWAPDPPPFPLSSTSGYALMAQHWGWWSDGLAPLPGDILLHSENGDVFHSDGQVGHTEIFDGILPNGNWNCMGSSGSGGGVGWRERRPSFWQRRIRVPGLHDRDAPIITPEQLIALARALEELDVEHGMAVDVTLNPANPSQGYTLDRWGGVHPFGGAPAVRGGPYWEGKDVARKVIIANWVTGEGYVLDLDGAMHSFNGAPLLQGTPYWKNGKIVAFNEI